MRFDTIWRISVQGSFLVDPHMPGGDRFAFFEISEKPSQPPGDKIQTRLPPGVLGKYRDTNTRVPYPVPSLRSGWFPSLSPQSPRPDETHVKKEKQGASGVRRVWTGDPVWSIPVHLIGPIHAGFADYIALLVRLIGRGAPVQSGAPPPNLSMRYEVYPDMNQSSDSNR